MYTQTCADAINHANKVGHRYTDITLVCRRNLEDMLRIPWHVAVFDEAHKLKNRNAKIYGACCALQTKLRYGLTGTAMQVCTATSLLQFVMEGGGGGLLCGAQKVTSMYQINMPYFSMTACHMALSLCTMHHTMPINGYCLSAICDVGAQKSHINAPNQHTLIQQYSLPHGTTFVHYRISVYSITSHSLAALKGTYASKG